MRAMRGDMAKVLVERPRKGGAHARKGRRPRDLEALPGFLGMGRAAHQSGDWKMLDDHLAPLRRFLERQVNRPWSKVYSEIRARIDPRNAVQAHLLAHLDQFIALHVRRAPATDRAPTGLFAGSSGALFSPLHALAPGDLYVDPADGIIKRARRRRLGT